MKRVTQVLMVPILLMVLGCQSSQSSEADGEAINGTITISGAFALYPLVNLWAETFRKEHPGIRFNISGGGAGKGMTDVLNGAADLAMYSKDISPVELEQGAYGFAVAKDAVIPTISAANPILEQILSEGFTRKELQEIFLKTEIQNWKSSTHRINVYTRSDAAGAAETWAKYLGAQAQEELKGVAVFGDPGLADAVRKDKNGIGYNNVIYVYDLHSGQKYPGIEVAPLDLDSNGKIDPEEDFYESLSSMNQAIAEGIYPSPPARALFLVAKGQPAAPELQLFIEWVLTSGQAYVQENGYIRLDEATISAQISKLPQ